MHTKKLEVPIWTVSYTHLNLQEGDILFVDEIHRLNRQVEEVLYPAMEDFAIDIMIGKGASARSIRLDLDVYKRQESYNQHLSKNLQIPVKQEPPRFHLPPSTDKASIEFLRIWLHRSDTQMQYILIIQLSQYRKKSDYILTIHFWYSINI